VLHPALRFTTLDRMVALAQSPAENISLKAARAPACARVRAHQPQRALADSRSASASSLSVAQQNLSTFSSATTTLQRNVARRNHRTQQYSITAITSSSGSVLERYAYTAYGAPTIANASGTVLTSSAISNRYTYTGREWDNDIQQYHYRARMYDASLGRFCGRDPIGYLDGMNLYHGYFAISRLDPSGTEVRVFPELPYKIVTPIPPGFWSYIPCGSFTFNYTFNATGPIGIPVPINTINWALQKLGYAPLVTTITWTGTTPCPPGYVCCISTIYKHHLRLIAPVIIEVPGPNVSFTAYVDVKTTLSFGNCRLIGCPCPKAKVVDYGMTSFTWSTITIQ
jgi:RHS repeat-associated protein